MGPIGVHIRGVPLYSVVLHNEGKCVVYTDTVNLQSHADTNRYFVKQMRSKLTSALLQLHSWCSARLSPLEYPHTPGTQSQGTLFFYALVGYVLPGTIILFM